MTDLPIVEFAYPGPLRDRHVAAVLSGEKTSTASLLIQYTEEELPRVGERGAVVDSAGVVVGVIETTGVDIVALKNVSLQHALDEGEGYIDVAHWRAGHERFWHSTEVRAELGDPDFTVDDDTRVVLERFILVPE
ncbi:ASCH domain-containing protein [Rhodococcus sp. IEGM 1401]|uniref:ASCH domain-containing protein n=1 Tax=Rhodococcus cercidiphylli TaxID=489916 RepID=A0ABU4AYJ5_9NOCA|nr:MULTISPECIES: ASCH domain-containing protein [Rhodococcus]MCZ4562012.1 ASCH domain-containing protein [Rhodococcus sp. IEGM 1401]MDI6629155.1 ASCH domain-containing protein [Rhodococcus sp. (in: high G+C Gram-positive bacteria)]MDI9922054.1 ASCH domain-containing protein [Rhodococcus sp. IEGM 1372]MDI9927629.1 ASCH domain-containing protein [Rhodococcus sp. IEGM 1341]MDV6231289.1 ASCH domain-containing protein [Rhodococcus cercidiphylli]